MTLADWITRSRFLVLAVAFLAFGPVAYTALRVMQSNSNNIEDWIPDDFQESKDRDWFNEHFVSDEMMLISWDGCKLGDPNIEEIATLLAQPFSLPADAAPHDIVGDEQPEIPESIQPFREIITPEGVIEQLQAEPLELRRGQAVERLQGWLVSYPHTSATPRTAAIIAKSSHLGWQYREHVLDHVFATVGEVTGLAPDAIHITGPSRASVAVDQASQAGMARNTAISLSVCLVLLIVSLRKPRLALLVFFAAIFCQQLSLTLIAVTGGKMDATLLIVPSLVFVLAVSGGVHLTNYYIDAVRAGEPSPAANALAEGWRPCLWAAGTTALGLISLSVSHVVPVRRFGFYAALGTIVSSGVLFLLLPAAWRQFPLKLLSRENNEPAGDTSQETGHKWLPLDRWVARWHWPILCVSLVVMAVAAVGLTRLGATVQLHDMFRANDPVVADYDWIEANIGPVVPIEVVVNVPRLSEEQTADHRYWMLEQLFVVQAARDAVGRVEGIDTTISALNFAPRLTSTLDPQAEASVGQLATRRGANRQMNQNRRYLAQSGFYRQTDDAQLWRISVRVAAGTRPEFERIMADLRREVGAAIEAQQPADLPPLSARYAGGMPLVHKAQSQMLDDLVNSFLLAFGLIAVAMVALLRRFSAGMLAMIPNIFPSVLMFGALGWADIPVDIGALLTATAAMGIAVDDTLHFLTWFRRGLRDGLPRQQAVALAYARCASAMTQTTLVCGLGLLVYVVSPFVPVARFSLLILGLLSLALLGDLIVLPAILLGPLGRCFEPRKLKQEPATVG